MALFETETSETIEKRMLNTVSDSLDKREGSIIYDATAPAAIEIAESYIMADAIVNETFATTASRPYLILRAAEFNIYPEEATYAVVKAAFNQAVAVGTRFNYGSFNFKVTSVIDDTAHTYKMTCETAGTGGNYCIGNITPINTISGLTDAAITEVITPGENEEDTEVFRKRYFAALKSQAYGGNGADYREKVMALAGVGGVKVSRCWNGGGTVKCVVLSSDYNVPDAEFVATLQTAIDPTPQGKGYGIAPIGHTVTVAAATQTAINVTATITPKSGVAVADLQTQIETKIKAYLENLRQIWCNQVDTEYLTARSAYIESSILGVAGVVDVTNSLVNGATKYEMAADAVPVLGTVTLTEG